MPAQPNNNQPIMPLPTAPLVDGLSGHITLPWFRFLVNLWNRTGGASIPISSAVIFVQGTLDSLVAFLVQGSGQVLLGTVLTASSQGQSPALLTPTVSPFTFTAGSAGTFVANSGTMSITRNGQSFAVGATGGCVPLMAGDEVQLVFNSPPASVVWLPSA
jgi:hypothetical protein